MNLKIYPNDKRIHYSLRLKDGKSKKIQLFEHIESINRSYSTPISIIYSWRSEMIKNFADRLQEENKLKKLYWGDEFNFKVDDGMRILVAMKLASSIKDRLRIEEAFDTLRRLSDEEVSFWVWKILSLKNRALTAFKAMYL